MSELIERFERVRREGPARPLVYRAATGDAVSADALSALVQSLRTLLNAAGAASPAPVVSVAGNTAAGVALLLACRALGVPLIPVDRSVGVAELESICRRFGARLIVAPGTLALDGGVAVHALDEGLSLFRLPDVEPAVAVPVDVAVMKLTSGSTGLPRATLTSEAHMLADAASIIEAMDIRPADVQLAAIPLSHAYGLGNLTLPLLVQGTPIVVRDGFVPHQFPQDCSTFRITMFPGVPFMFDHLLEHLPDGEWPRRLSRLITAGAKIEGRTVAGVARKFGVKIHSFYGTSETGGICYDDSGDLDADPTVGRPMPNVTVTLKAEEGAPADGGRVHVAGPAVASGYARGPEEAGDEDPFVAGGFLTGDLARFDGRGHLEIHGRVSSFVNVAGRKVQPGEVEAALRLAPGVLDVRVLGAPDPRRGQQLVACVVPSGERPSIASLRAFCSGRLAAYKIPRQFIFLEQMPLTERGKLDRARLERLVAGHAAGDAVL